MSEPWALDVTAALDQIRHGELSPVGLVTSCLSRIDELEVLINAWEHLDGSLAVSTARATEPGPLHGIPFGIKDIFNTADMPTAMGSPLWSRFTPGNDARVVHNARRAGAVAMGKTVTAEFAVHHPGATRNPHDPDRSPGTSSSGSAAAVCAGMVPWALGSQTAGSIVRPASYVGIYGLKPSYGLVPRTGMLKTTDTLDTIGLFARSARDLPVLLDAVRVSGSDYPLIHRTVDRMATGDPAGARVAVLRDQLAVSTHSTPEANEAFGAFARHLEESGVRLVDVPPPESLDSAHDVHATLYDRSLAYYFAEEAKTPALLSDRFLEMIERGNRIERQAFTAALDAQEALRRDFAAWMEQVDIIVTLTTGGAAPAFGDEDRHDTSLIWTLVGAPSLSVPALTLPDGMPLGVQIVARRFDDRLLLAFAQRLVELGLVTDPPPVTPIGGPVPEGARPTGGLGRRPPVDYA